MLTLATSTRCVKEAVVWEEEEGEEEGVRGQADVADTVAVSR